jgi:RNA polymerase sigma factor (sigma-70 family)
MTDKTDEQLMHDFYNADKQASDAAFNELDARYRARIICYFHARGVQSQAAQDDLAQDVLFKVLRSKTRGSRFDPQKSKFKTWLFLMASRKHIDGWRKGQHAPASMAPELLDAQPALPGSSSLDLRDLLESCRQRLSEDERQALALIEALGEKPPLRQLARALGKSQATASRVLERVCNKLEIALLSSSAAHGL